MTAPHRWWNRWPVVAWLTIVWVLFWGQLTVGNVLAGIVLGTLVATLAPLPRVGFEARPSLVGVLVLLGRFAVDVVRASLQVAAAALRPGRLPAAAVVRVRLRSHSDLVLTLTSQICSLVPGSIIVEAHRHTGTLYVHVFDVDAVGGIDGARREVLDTEERVMRAIASDADLVEAGMRPRRRLLRRKEVSA